MYCHVEEWQKEGAAVYSYVLPNTEGEFLCKRHNATSLDVHPVNAPRNASLNEHTDSEMNQDKTDSLFDEQCSLEID